MCGSKSINERPRMIRYGTNIQAMEEAVQSFYYPRVTAFLSLYPSSSSLLSLYKITQASPPNPPESYGDTRNSLSHALLLPLSLSNFCSFQNINIHHVLNWSWLPSSTFVNIHMPLFWIIKRKFLTSLTITLPSRCPPPRSSHSSSAWTAPCIHQRRWIHILFYALVAAAAGYRFN